VDEVRPNVFPTLVPVDTDSRWTRFFDAYVSRSPQPSQIEDFYLCAVNRLFQPLSGFGAPSTFDI